MARGAAARQNRKPFICTSAQSTDAASPGSPNSFDGWYQPNRGPLEPHFGHVKIVSLDGRGRGVIATSLLQPGDLVMVARPVTISNGKPGADRLDGDALVDHLLEGDRAVLQSRWFSEFLFDGSTKAVWPVPDPLQLSELTAAPSAEPAPERSETPAIDGPAAVQATSAAAAGSVPAKVSKKALAAAAAAAAAAAMAGKMRGFKTAARGKAKGAQQQPPSAQAQQAAAERQLAKRISKIVSFNCYGKRDACGPGVWHVLRAFLHASVKVSVCHACIRQSVILPCMHTVAHACMHA